MKKADIFTWIKNEFLPIRLAIGDVALNQTIDNAVRYWNTHSAFRLVLMADINFGLTESGGSGGYCIVPPEMKQVVQAWPAAYATSPFYENPQFSLLGVVLLDNVTSDLVLMSEAFKAYKAYVGADFHWQFEKGTGDMDPGRLLISNLPVRTSQLCLLGTKRIMPDEDVVSSYLLDFLLFYTKALVKINEGNILRKSSIVGINNDGQALVTEGKEEKKDLEEKLMRESRWCVIGRRF